MVIMFFLVVLLLVLASSCTGQHGEYCHGWADVQGSWHPGFQCPERYDPGEATFCCGSCSLRYCCSTIEARLDQGLCPSEEELDVPGVELPPSVPTYFPFLLVGSVFVSFVITGSLVGLCCCKCLKPDDTQGSGPLPIQSRLLDVEPSTDLSRHSSSSSNSVIRTSLGNRPQNLCTHGAENVNLYMNMQSAYPMMGCPQNGQFVHPAGTAYLQPPFMNYTMQGEHTIIMTPASYIDARSCYGQSSNIYPTLAPQNDQTMYHGTSKIISSSVGNNGD
ncbi:protein shisa-1-like [Bombina bombina]|uniref:protein shisa-1-like n=1 Tax=Bombina bombina TaxID=8345 RepID=UPI00235B141D|nr:protein shisa-1-like [Bombina bombina]